MKNTRIRQLEYFKKMGETKKTNKHNISNSRRRKKKLIGNWGKKQWIEEVKKEVERSFPWDKVNDGVVGWYNEMVIYPRIALMFSETWFQYIYIPYLVFLFF